MKSYCNIIVIIIIIILILILILIIIIIIITIVISALGVVKNGKGNYIGKISVNIRITEVQN